MEAGVADRTVGALLPSDPLLVWPDTPVSEVAALLDGNGISGVPVVDWLGYLVGVVSEMDLLRVRASDNLAVDWERLCARHVMSQAWFSVTLDTPLERAVRLLESLQIHRLVVVGDDGESPIGVLSAADLARAMVGR
jgi:CBS domain-containing protein